MEQTLNMRR